MNTTAFPISNQPTLAPKTPAPQGSPQVPAEEAVSSPFVSVPAQAFKGSALAAPRFSGLLNEDYHVEFRTSEPINASTVSAATRALLMRHITKKTLNDPSTLKLFLDAYWTNSFIGTSRAALADLFTQVDRKIDVIVKADLDDLGLMALLSATGKRFLYEGARISMGPILDGAGYTRNDDHQIRREWLNEYTRDLESLIMSRAGVTDRSSVYWKDLNSAKGLNALQALHYGKNGLADAVIVGHDRVVTREDLDRYIEEKQLQGPNLVAFLNDPHNVKKLPTQRIQAVYPESVPPKDDKRLAVYVSPKDLLASAAQEKSKTPEGEKPEGEKKDSAENNNELTFYIGTEKGGFSKAGINRLGLGNRVREKDITPQRIFIDNAPGNRSFLEDDAIYFNDPFLDETAEPMSNALMQLDQKKQAQKSPSHIKIVVNSPGGSVSSGNEIRSTIAQAKTKVDVIVNGMAASCGAFLVSSATGNRFATPNARIMIHDAWWSRPYEPSPHYNETLDRLDQTSHSFVKAIALASGRPFKDVWEDMKVDVWLNPLESMFYGKKGLTDGILVGEERVITRQEVLAYLAQDPYIQETYGPKKPVEKYLKARIASLRIGKRDWKPEEHNERDPFENPLRTIQTIAAQSARPLASVPAFVPSLPKGGEPIDMITISMNKGGTGKDGGLSDESKQVLAFLDNKFQPLLSRKAPAAGA